VRFAPTPTTAGNLKSIAVCYHYLGMLSAPQVIEMKEINSMKNHSPKKQLFKQLGIALDLFALSELHQPEVIIWGNVKSKDLKTFSIEVMRSVLGFDRTDPEIKKNNEKTFSQSNCLLGEPNFPHPFLYAMDALLTDPGLVKETKARLKVAIKYFNDPNYF
jgi:hypothetical protein